MPASASSVIASYDLSSSRKRAIRGKKLATVAQPCGYPVDGQMDRLHHALVRFPSSMTLQQLDLYMVERFERENVSTIVSTRSLRPVASWSCTKSIAQVALLACGGASLQFSRH
jgi:hypothetical protein